MARFWLTHPYFFFKLIGVVIVSSWFACVMVTSFTILPTKEYQYDVGGSKVRVGIQFGSKVYIKFLQVCQPFYASPNIKILTVCLYFFLPTMTLMYCYGSIFHMNKTDKNLPAQAIDDSGMYTSILWSTSSPADKISGRLWRRIKNRRGQIR